MDSERQNKEPKLTNAIGFPGRGDMRCAHVIIDIRVLITADYILLLLDVYEASSGFLLR